MSQTLSDLLPGVKYGAKVRPNEMIGVEARRALFGKTYYCVKSTDSQFGRIKADFNTIYADGNEAIQTDLDVTLALLKPYDTIILAAGDWSGDHVTPLNADAPWCRIFGEPGAYMEPATSSKPCIEVKARGWRFSGIEFDAGATGSGLKMSKIAGLTERGADFFTVDNCLFFGGKTGIDFAGGGTYWNILNNHFSLIDDNAGGGGIFVSSSSYQIPALGQIDGNRFDNNINHINGGGTRGFSDTIIRANNFMLDSAGQDATILMSIKGNGGGNSVIGNYFDIPLAQFNTGGTQRVFSNSTDYGAGNHFQDGEQGSTMRQ